MRPSTTETWPAAILKDCLILNIIKIIQYRHKQLFYNIFSQIYSRYGDQIVSEPYMDNYRNMASGHLKDCLMLNIIKII